MNDRSSVTTSETNNKDAELSTKTATKTTLYSDWVNQNYTMTFTQALPLKSINESKKAEK